MIETGVGRGVSDGATADEMASGSVRDRALQPRALARIVLAVGVGADRAALLRF